MHFHFLTQLLKPGWGFTKLIFLVYFYLFIAILSVKMSRIIEESLVKRQMSNSLKSETVERKKEYFVVKYFEKN